MNRQQQGDAAGREISFLAELFEGSSQPFGISYPDGAMAYVNGAFEHLTGYSRDVLGRMDWTASLTPPEWLGMERAMLEELCRTGNPVTYEKEYIRKDGSRIPVELLAHLKRDESGSPLYFYSFITDISERKSTDERIRHLSYFPQFNPNPIIETDYRGTVTFCNPATDKIVETIGAGAHAGLLVPADLDAILGNWDRKSETTHHREISIGTRAFREIIFLTPQFAVVRIYVHEITDIRQAEKALGENERRLRLFIEHAPAGLAMFDRDMRYLSASRRWLSDYGLGDRDLRGLCHYEVFPDIPETWKEIHRLALAGEELRAEGDRFERADGSVQWIRWEIHPWYDSSDRVGGIVIFSEDITESKKAEERILHLNQELEQRVTELQLILDTSPIGLAITNDPEGATIRGNPALEKLLGVPAGSELSKNALNSSEYRVFREGVELAPSELPMQRAVRGDTVSGETLDIERNDGTVLNLYCSAATLWDKEGVPSGAVGAFMDITERKELENVVMKSQLDVYAILDNIPYRAWLKDTEGHYVKVNWPFATACGFPSPKEVIGKTDLDLWPSHLAEAFRADDQEVMQSGQRKFVEEYMAEKGVERWFETFKAPRFDQNGRVVGTTGISRDITEHKRAAQALQSAHDDLEQKVAERTWQLAAALNDLRKESSDRIQALEALREQEQLLIHQGRLAAMGEMIGNIAHQWRQPLNTLGLIIQGFPLIQESGEFSKEQLDERVDRAMQVIFHMSQTIDDFRNFFRPDKEKVLFPVKRIISNALSLIGENFQSLGIQVSFDCQRELSIKGYPNEFSQAVLNILMNARDVIEERKVDAPRVAVRMFTEESSRVVVTIADNAGGIDGEIIGKIFDPYFTSKGPNKGTGLGLFISKTIIEKNMDGALTVRNTGDGAEFRIEV